MMSEMGDIPSSTLARVGIGEGGSHYEDRRGYVE